MSGGRPGLLQGAATIVLIALAAGGVTACHRNERDRVLVAGAMSLRDVLRDATAEFEGGNPDVSVDLEVASSGVLMRQIQAGAPVDVFFSASPRETSRLRDEDFLVPDTVRTIASNRLTTVFPPGREPVTDLEELLEPRFRRVAVGNPATVPAGHYARQALSALGLWHELKPRLVFAEHVRQVAEYVARGEVDAGVVYRTDALRFRERLVIGPEAPAGSHDAVRYEAAVVREAPNAELARRFLDLVASERGRAVLERYGFEPWRDG